MGRPGTLSPAASVMAVAAGSGMYAARTVIRSGAYVLIRDVSLFL